MNEAIFDISVILAGYGALSSMRARLPWAFLAFLAWPVGCFSWLFAVVVALSFGAGAKVALSLHLIISACVFWLGIRHSRGQERIMYLSRAGVLTIVGLTISIAAQVFRMTQGSFDSFELVALGRSLLILGFRPDVSAILASWGVLLPVIHGASVAVKVEFLSSVQPLFFVSLLGLFFLGTNESARFVSKGKNPGLPLIGLASMLLLGTTYTFAFQSVYIHNSMLSAVYLMIYFVGIIVARNRENEKALWVAVIGLLGFTLCRTEAPLFAAIAMISGAYLLLDSPIAAGFGRKLIFYTAIISAWYGILVVSIGTGTDTLTPWRAGLQILALIVVTAAISLTASIKFLQRLIRFAPEILLSGAILAASAAFVWKSGHIVTSLHNVLENMFYSGFWSSSWTILALLLGLTFLGPASRLRDAILSFGVAFFVLVLVLVLFRVPYRLGFGDSANRILTHLMPILLMGVTAHLMTIGRTPSLISTRLPRAALFLLMLLATFAVSVPLSAHYLLPENIAAKAVVLEAHNFCPKNRWGEYGFDVALRHPKNDAYAAACGVGERNVVIEFPRPATPRWLEIEEVQTSERWTDFAIYGSSDRRAWIPLYDTRTKALIANLERTSPVRFRIDIHEHHVFRYLRVEFRASKGQNRLLLRSFEVYADR